MIVYFKTFSENGGNSPFQDVKDTVTSVIEPVTTSIESIKEHLPDMSESRFRRIVNQYKNWWNRSKKESKND